jgi:LysR family transcriptional regulator, low CO2-responsive transcriptional regulator
MELNHLRHFWSVARAGGFTSAARQVHVQQPGLSRAVRQLEGDLGVVLLEREKRGVRLTKVGKEIYETCERIFREVENVQTLADSERNDCRGVLRFAVSSELASDLLPEVLARYQVRYAEVWPMMFSGPSTPMLEEIARGESELGLFFHLPRKRDELSDMLFAKVPFKLVIAKERAQDRAVRASFIGSREIDDGSTKHYPTVDRIRRDLPDVRIRISSNDATARKRMVLAGIGVAILPTFMVESELASGALAELYREEKFEFDLRLVARSGRILPRAARLLLDEIRGALGVTPRAPAGRDERSRARRAASASRRGSPGS